MLGKLRPILLVTLVGGTVFAQPAPAPTTQAPAIAGDVKTDELANMSPGQMVAQSQAYVQAMNDVLKRIQILQESARRTKDIIKLNCVTDKLTQTKVNLNLADTGTQGMQEAFGRQDNQGAQHQFSRLTILNQKTTLLGAEAENCVGEDLTFIGKAKVDVEIDPSIPDHDPTQPLTPPHIVERPPEASPYR